MPKSFNVILTGRVAPGHAREATAAALAKMMRLPEERTLALLAGKETVVKRNLDEASVARYAAAFSPTGAEIRTEEIKAAEIKAGETKAQPSAASAAETVKCPACGAEQPKRNLCRQCGGDMRRLAAAKQEAPNAPVQAAVPGSLRGGMGAAAVPGWVEQETFTPNPLNPFSFTGRIGRLRYLAYAFPAYLPLIGAAILGGVLGGMKRSMGTFFTLLIIGALVTSWLGMRMAILRLHDLNRSGLWVLLPFLTGLLIATGVKLLIFGSVALLLLGMLALCVWPGSMISNDYGPPPGPNTTWTIVGAALFILLSVIGGFTGGRAGH